MWFFKRHNSPKKTSICLSFLHVKGVKLYKSYKNMKKISIEKNNYKKSEIILDIILGT